MAFNDDQTKRITQAASKPASTPVKMAPQPDVPSSVMAERQARNRNTPNQGGTITKGGNVYEYAGSPYGQNVKPTVTPQAEYQSAVKMAQTTPVEAPRAAAPAPSAAPIPQTPAAKPMPGPAFGQTAGPTALGPSAALGTPTTMRLFEHAYNVPTMAPPAAPTMGPAPVAPPPAAPPAAPSAQPSFFGTDRDNAATGVARRFNPANYKGPTKGSAAVFTYQGPQPKVKTPGLDKLPPARRLGFTSNGGRVQPGQDRRSVLSGPGTGGISKQLPTY